MFIKKISLIIFFILLSITTVLSVNEQVFLIIDAPHTKNLDANLPLINCPGDDTLPRNWRMCTDILKNNENIPMPSLEGYNTLNISGSGSFSTGQFEKLREALGERKVIIIDLREESHGLVNNMCVSWYKTTNNLNEGKSLEEISLIEKNLLNKLKDDGKTDIDLILKRPDMLNAGTWDIKKIPVKVEQVMTEEELVTEYGYGYYRIPVTDLRRPEDNEVNDFINFYKNLSGDTWLHFHCKAGKGRTTTFMAMYDMMKNYDKVKKEDIINRQWISGGLNLMDIDDPGNINIEWAKARRDFILKFYDYCSQKGPDYKITWTEWLKGKVPEQ
ncbi:MAG: phosphatase [Candidatus Eremiobacterota bacterium]